MLVKILVIIVYLGLIAILGVLGYKHTKTSSDYLLGNRRIHPLVMALSYGATFISTSAIVGFGGVAGVFGMSVLWLTFMNIFFGVFIAFVFFGKRTRRMGQNLNVHTFPEFLGERYQSAFVRKFAGLVIFIFMPVYTTAVMIGAAKFIEGSLQVDYNIALFVFSAIIAAYVFFGGLRGVMYSDAFQGSLMLLGMAFLIISVYTQLGGVSTAHTRLTELMSKPDVLDQIAGIQGTGFQGWTKMPTLFSQNWWVVISTIVMGVGIGVLAQPQLIVRFMTVKSDKQLNRAVPVGGIFIIMMTGVAFVVGSLSNVLFYDETGQVAIAAAGGTDSIIPTFLEMFMPTWFLTAFLLILLAAGMSTISSQFHAIGTAVGRDIFSKKSDDATVMLYSRIGVLIGIVITIILAYVLPQVWDGAIAISTGLFFGLCGASFLPMYFGALYVKNLSKTAALAGMLTGFCSSLLWMMFIHGNEARVLGVSRLLFGRDVLVEQGVLQFVNPIVIALSLSIIVTIVVHFLTKSQYSEEHIEKCFNGF